jgi:hypothetical protein
LLALPIYLSHRNISIMETALSCGLPTVPREQLLEAIACGLHLEDHSALRQAVASHAAVPVATDGLRFVAHLARYGHAVPVAAFLGAGALSALDMVSRFMPLLGRSGYAAFSDQRDFAKDRALLVSPISVPGFLQATRFLQGEPSAASSRPSASSYTLKHLAERQVGVWSDGRRAGPNYVANGELIAAGIYVGRTWAHDGLGSPNIMFNVDLKKLERAERKAMCARASHAWHRGFRSGRHHERGRPDQRGFLRAF